MPALPAFVILNLIASGHFASLTVEIPQGRIGWIRWKPEDGVSRSYQGAVEGRLVIELGADAEERDAQWVAEVLSALLDLVHGPSGITLGVLEVPAEAVTEGEVSEEDVRKELALFDPRWEHATSAWWPTDHPIWTSLQALPAVLEAGDRDRGLPAALLYYKLSTAEFAFMGDSVTWALGEEGTQVAESAYDRGRVEQAFHNSFKAIEALIGGEPSASSDRRFRQRLLAVGVDPDEAVGFRGRPKEPLFDVISRVRKTRDARAAHGGRTSAARRGIIPVELMEAQHAAAAALTHAVLHVAPAAGDRPPTDELGALQLNASTGPGGEPNA
jgi:hypothetical protein